MNGSAAGVRPAQSARTPLVSVIMPGKDVAAFVGDALNSLTRQFDDLADLEVVFIDDGSVDGSLRFVEERSNRFPNFQSIRNDTSRGLAAARNQGMAASRGGYISFLDGDDWLAPGHLASLARDIQRLECDFLRTDIVFTTGKQRTVRRAPQFRRGVVLDPRESILPVDRGTMVDHPFAPAGLFDRSLIDRGLLQFGEQLLTAEDRPWIWRLFLRAQSYAVVECPGYLYRRGVSESLTQIVDARRLAYLRAFDQVRMMVEEDAETDRFMPKVIQTILALTAHHLDSYELMPADVQKTLVDGARELLAGLPPDGVREAVERMPGDRAQRLALVLGDTSAGRAKR